MVMEFCFGGDLSNKLSKKGRLTEDEVRFCMVEVILALQHLHSMGIIYRDIKPENMLLDSSGHIKLGDFGLAAKDVEERERSYTSCGTPEYLSPEMVQKVGYGKETDFFGLGSVMYELLHGSSPFTGETIESIKNNIIKEDVRFKENISLSPEAKSLILKLLQKDPRKRLGANGPRELRNHPFFKGVDWEAYKLKLVPPPPDFVPKINFKIVKFFSISLMDSLSFKGTDPRIHNKRKQIHKGARGESVCKKLRFYSRE